MHFERRPAASGLPLQGVRVNAALRRIGNPHNLDSEALLGGIDRTRLKHVIGAHLSKQNNKPALARAALASAMGCEEGWSGIAGQDDGFDGRTI